MSKVKSYSLEELSKHHEATLSNVSRYVAERDYIELQQRNAELAAQVEQLKEEKAELISGQEILKEGLLAASEHLPLRFADPFFRNDGKLFLKLRDREVAAKAVEYCAKSLINGAIVNHWCKKEQNGYIWCYKDVLQYANKIKSGEVEI